MTNAIGPKPPLPQQPKVTGPQSATDQATVPEVEQAVAASLGWQPTARPRAAPTATSSGTRVVSPTITIDTAPGYSTKTALAMGELANATYLAPEAAAAQLKQWGFDSMTALAGTQSGPLGITARDTQGFVAGSKDAIVVGFRGTESSAASDWLTDAAATFRVANGTHGSVHRGFSEAFALVEEPMMKAIAAEWEKDKAAGRPPRPVYFTGHSLGGALATLGAMRLQEGLNEKKTDAQPGARIGGVYSYGSPKVGSPEFAKYYDETLGLAAATFRHVNNNDKVARVPSGIGPLKEWTHVGQANERYFTADGKKTLVGTTDADAARAEDRSSGRGANLRRLLRGAWDRDFSNPLPDNLNDHLMAHYLENLDRQVGR